MTHRPACLTSIRGLYSICPTLQLVSLNLLLSTCPLGRSPACRLVADGTVPSCRCQTAHSSKTSSSSTGLSTTTAADEFRVRNDWTMFSRSARSLQFYTSHQKTSHSRCNSVLTTTTSRRQCHSTDLNLNEGLFDPITIPGIRGLVWGRE